MKKWIQLILLIVILSLGGCMRAPVQIPATPSERLIPVSAADIDFADDLNFESLEIAVERSIRYYEGAGKNYVYRMPERLVDARLLKDSLKTFLAALRSKTSRATLNDIIGAKFDVYRVLGEDSSSNAFFTGYYEPLLEGSLVRTEKYRYPLYHVPPDLIRQENKIGRMANGDFIPYYSRYEIDAQGALSGKNLEIAWVSDPLDLFSLHIQGSGKIRLEDGRLLTVGFAQSNGRPFRSVTRYMLEGGRISPEEASYRHAFLQGKTDAEIYDILGHNERYVFFRFLKTEPIGSLGQPVTPDRSIATDPDYFPEGALAFIRLRKPVFDADGHLKERVDFSRFVLSQDRGSAIKGPGRVDLFCGFGARAEYTAGTLKENGELYLLIKK